MRTLFCYFISLVILLILCDRAFCEEIYGCPYCEWVSTELKPPVKCPICKRTLEIISEGKIWGAEGKAIVFNNGECKTCEYPTQWVAIYSCPEEKRSFSPFKCDSESHAEKDEVLLNYYCPLCDNYNMYYSRPGECNGCQGQERIFHIMGPWDTYNPAEDRKRFEGFKKTHPELSWEEWERERKEKQGE